MHTANIPSLHTHTHTLANRPTLTHLHTCQCRKLVSNANTPKVGQSDNYNNNNNNIYNNIYNKT